MKKMLPFFLGLLLGLALWAYERYFNKVKSFHGIDKETFTTFIESDEFKKLEKDYYATLKAHGEPIDFSEARTMISANTFSTKSLWFASDTIIKYLKLWKAVENATGVRTYFANYGNSTYGQVNGLTNLPTIVFVPTFDSLASDGTTIFRVDLCEVNRPQNAGYLYPVNRGFSCPPYPPEVCSGQRY